MPLAELLEKYPGSATRYVRNIGAVRGAFAPKRMKKTKVFWLWGDSGVGKSYYARVRAGPDAHHQAPEMGKWWDGYIGQKKVVFDEFRDSLMKPASLWALMDEGPHKLQTKGGSTEYAAEELFITSNKNPYDMYGKVEDISPLWRRLEHSVYQCKGLPRHATMTATRRPMGPLARAYVNHEGSWKYRAPPPVPEYVRPEYNKYKY